MREQFRAYYRPSASEMTELWHNGLVILDTNALLNLFRYSQRTREDFLRALAAKNEALWIPHQVGKEFHRNRINIINKQSKAFVDIEEALSKARAQVGGAFNNYKRHPSLDIDPLQAEFAEAIDRIVAQVRAAQEQHVAKMLDSKTNDEILADITDLYDLKVGSPFSEEQLLGLYKEGASRYEKSVPPGYKDSAKSEPERYGDLVLWRQILAHGAEVQKPAIFVTDDQKEDWWYTVDSERHGARPELVEEYYASAGERIHFMTTDRFLDFAKAVVQDIRSESVDELELLSRERALHEATHDRATGAFSAAGSWPESPVHRSTRWRHAGARDPRTGQPTRSTDARMRANSLAAAARNELIMARAMASAAQNALDSARQLAPDDEHFDDYARHLESLEHDLDDARTFAAIAESNLDYALQEDARVTRGGQRNPERIGDVVNEALGVLPLDFPHDIHDDDHGWAR